MPKKWFHEKKVFCTKKFFPLVYLVNHVEISKSFWYKQRKLQGGNKEDEDFILCGSPNNNAFAQALFPKETCSFFLKALGKICLSHATSGKWYGPHQSWKNERNHEGCFVEWSHFAKVVPTRDPMRPNVANPLLASFCITFSKRGQQRCLLQLTIFQESSFLYILCRWPPIEAITVASKGGKRAGVAQKTGAHSKY